MNVTKLIGDAGRKAVQTAAKNSPTILAGVAIAGVVATAVMMVKATLKSREILDEREDQITTLEEKFENDPSIDEETQKELRKQVNINAAKALLPIYAPAIITLGMTVACVIGCNSVHIRRQAALAAAYNLSESTLRSYEAKAKELVGAKKSGQIKDEANIERMKKIIASNSEIIETGHGSEIFIDKNTGQKFRSSQEYVKNKMVDIGNRLKGVEFIPLNDLLIDWGCNMCEFGDQWGFSEETFAGPNSLTPLDQLEMTHWTDPDDGITYHYLSYPLDMRYFSPRMGI